ncbi:hypothetical protein [Methyloversatilis sp.]
MIHIATHHAVAPGIDLARRLDEAVEALTAQRRVVSRLVFDH